MLRFAFAGTELADPFQFQKLPRVQSLSRHGGRRRVWLMRYFLLMIAVGALVGCGESSEEKAAKAKAEAAAEAAHSSSDEGAAEEAVSAT